MSLSVIVLAAGQGTRMRSHKPKMLHSIAGKSILSRILSTIQQLKPQKLILVHGYQGEQLKNAFQAEDIIWVEQQEQKGTGHAALQALPFMGENKVTDRVLIFYGDIPLISSETLKDILHATAENQLGLVTLLTEDPSGLGRIVRDEKGNVLKIVEEKDASFEEKKIKEINTGFFVLPKNLLMKWLPQLTPQNAQQEYYLSDLIALAVAEGITISTVFPKKDWEVLGVNTKVQLADLERLFQKEQAIKLMTEGVTLLDPARFDLRGDITVGADVVIDVNVILEGHLVIGNNVYIGPNVYIKDAIIKDNVRILANSVIEEASIESGCLIGPFARVRPGTELGQNVHVGNFVEIKNSNIGSQSKMNHLSYIGDARVGSHVNIGAGTITCNYDGKEKHKTVIGDRTFIGSDTQLIAPITIGNDVTIGAGTTVVKDVPAHCLIHNRVEHRRVAKEQK